ERLNLIECACAEMDLTNTRVEKSVWLKMDLSTCRWRGAALDKVMLIECNLSGLDFSGQQFDIVTFMSSNLTGTIFNRARLVQCNFSKVKAVAAEFDHVEGPNTIFIEAEI